MDHEGIEYIISPDAELVQELMQQVLDSEQGTVGIKLLPFVDDPGITYNYRVRFEDGTGEVIREEILPVFVDAAHRDPNNDSASESSGRQHHRLARGGSRPAAPRARARDTNLR